MGSVTVFFDRDFQRQISALYQRGGKYQKAAEKAKALYYDLKFRSSDPIKEINKIPKTHHGESRIQHCVKYDLPGFARLVTIQDNGWLILLYLGTHEEVEKWLDNNKGRQVGIKDVEQGLFDIFKSPDINDPETRVSPQSEMALTRLYTGLKQYYDEIAGRVSGLVRRTLESLSTLSDEEEILEVSLAIPDVQLQDMVFDVFMLLRGGKVDEAKNRILVYKEQLTLLSDLPEEVVKNVASNDQYVKLDDLEEEDLKLLMDHKNWLEWMLFMHPAQKAVVDHDFSGSARLLGVSGSGKTCIVVRRAVRLARKYPGQKILILTLNRSLSGLIQDLTFKLLREQHDRLGDTCIEVKSFWEVCRDLIIEIRNHHLDRRILNSTSDKHNENVDDIWNEFYHCENNNLDADILFPVHGMLLARGIYPKDYIKQEYDWIRSFLSFMERNQYRDVEREGRSIPLQMNEREKLLAGLESWETKMRDIGVIDYLGLANELYKYYDKLVPRYRCILIDEVQDFGTLELKIIRKLVNGGENDLFIAGDIAQQVYSKHHKLRNAGITILPEAYRTILKNYRNSREILSAAYEVFKGNTNEEQFKSDDFELLKPEYANFSSPKPFLRKAERLEDEIVSAISYLNDILGDSEKGCIAFCGYSLYQVQHMGKKLKLPVLDGTQEIGNEKIYLSDLEQTKGFEFDRMVIVNANERVIPDYSLPTDESYRDISKFYVAMTRAKKELIISYSAALSRLFDKVKEYFNYDTWAEHVLPSGLQFEMPDFGDSNLSGSEFYKVTGKEFLYHKKALGVTKELQTKLIEHVAGKTVSLGIRKVGWASMSDLKNDVGSKRNIPQLSSLFGPTVYRELEILFNR